MEKKNFSVTSGFVLHYYFCPSSWAILTFLVDGLVSGRAYFSSAGDVWVGVVRNWLEGRALACGWILTAPHPPLAPTCVSTYFIGTFQKLRALCSVFAAGIKSRDPPGPFSTVVSSECPADCFECRSIIPAQTEPFFFDLTERAAFLRCMVDSGCLRQCFPPTCGL